MKKIAYYYVQHRNYVFKIVDCVLGMGAIRFWERGKEEAAFRNSHKI